ncbi:MAG: hypothetical protein MUP41_09510 [Desulfobacterales bacterium]|nr:hypothetical protein [Desulfobacterales bacterium]
MDKPKCRLIGEDGNVFNIIGRVLKALKKAGQDDKANEFQTKAMTCRSYAEVLNLCGDYVEIE